MARSVVAAYRKSKTSRHIKLAVFKESWLSKYRRYNNPHGQISGSANLGSLPHGSLKVATKARNDFEYNLDDPRDLESSIPDYDEKGKWIAPQDGLHLSDLLVYIASKDCTNKELAERWPYDFDSNGNVHSSLQRRSKDPPPLLYAHGLARIAINRDTVALGGRQLAPKLTALRKNSDKAMARTGGAWSIGLILAPPEFVKRNIAWARRSEVHGGETIIEGKEQITLDDGSTLRNTLRKHTASEKIQSSSQLRTMELFQQRENELVSNERLWFLVIGS
ncbi:hypothetical protein N7541_005347 [Penicillium brevicompactum]|uniref:Uncharacterized protein n=1 Tax=Penicillium brevicompactum TaxID=5074 RepID=A0A9W9RFX3_PENBR|nr:hypothetical protein N7541_005347 [Penicillium brevicompactum]